MSLWFKRKKKKRYNAIFVALFKALVIASHALYMPNKAIIFGGTFTLYVDEGHAPS